MKLIKRNCELVAFDYIKIYKAILKAMNTNGGENEELAMTIAKEIETEFKHKEEISIYDVEDAVFHKLIGHGQELTAKAYEGYRAVREHQRETSNTDTSVMELLTGTNEYLKSENSNKNPTINSVQRDYMAGEVSKDLTKRVLLPLDISYAHDEGIIHFHDSDYFAQPMNNCGLVNLEDMLQNGTVISDVLIEKPHSFSTACNIATQIIAQVASSQYGGQSISLAHLAPFVDISRQKIRKEVEEEWYGVENSIDKQHKINQIVEKRLLKEIKKGVQTIQYQVVTLMTTNGQAPFLTIFMYLNETKNEQEKIDLALIIEEVIKQRKQGVKDENGVWITPAFPKLVYVLEDDNIEEDSDYFYLTRLSAECTTKRLVPDYISEKVMKEWKEGNCFPVMG